MNYFFAVNFFFAHIFLHTKAVCYSMLITLSFRLSLLVRIYCSPVEFVSSSSSGLFSYEL